MNRSGTKQPKKSVASILACLCACLHTVFACFFLVLCSADIVSTLRAAHAADPKTRMGIDIVKGEAADVTELGVFESFKVKSQMLSSATEAAEMILRVDDIVKAAPRRRG
jgi:chaperonin GroEL (HSP60 family)